MQDISIIRAALETQRATITTDLEQIAQYNPETGDWEALPADEQAEADPNSEADGAEESEERSSTVALLETTFRDITKALEKIAAGTYGACEVCGAVIEDDRLSFLPTARTCKEHLEEEQTLAL